MKIFRIDFKYVKMDEPETAFVIAESASDALVDKEVLELMAKYSSFDLLVTEVPMKSGLLAVEYR